MRDLIDLIERASAPTVTLKKAIIDMVKQTQEDSILNRVLKVLKAGNLDERVVDIINSDIDAKAFVSDIADSILKIDAPVEEKNAFLDNFKKGIIDTEKLLDGKPHTIAELVGPGFNTALFVDLSSKLSSHGVGPGELALAIMSPKIKWTGRVAGGGDIMVNNKPIEVKTTRKQGGRWINPRKANMDLQRIKQTLEKATGIQVPDRVNINTWVNTFRPAVQPKDLDKVTKIIADSIFKFTSNTDYQKALKSGSAAEIIGEHIKTGYNNYKALTNFKGILMVDLPSNTIQYFENYESMVGNIKPTSTYIYAPETEMMPKIDLISRAATTDTAAPDLGATSPSQPAAVPPTQSTTPAAPNVPLNKAAKSIAAGTIPKQQVPTVASNITRKKRK